MAERVNFTAGRVRSHACPKGKSQAFLWDSAAPGLGLRATPTGAQSYIFQGRIHARTVRVTIGDLRTWSIDQAREEARRLQMLIDCGKDPRQAKAEQEAADQEKRRQTLLGKTPAIVAWQEYMEARKAKWSDRHYADHQAMCREGGEKITRGRRAGVSAERLPGILRPLLVLPLQEISRDQVAAWLNEQAKLRPTRARLATSLLATFLNWCSDQPGWRDQVQVDACIRMKKDLLPKPKAKDDCLQREQLKPWFDAVRRIPNPVQAAYLQVVLLTGARREEVAGLRWDDVDFQWKSLSIRDKVEGERTIGLTPYVEMLLRDLHSRIANAVRRLDGQDKSADLSPWVFHSPASATGRIQEPRLSHNKALQAAGLPHLTIHGLRRSFGTLAEWVECPAGISAQIMGHKPSAIAEKHYRHRPLDLLRTWHSKIEAWILEQAEIKQPEESFKPHLRVMKT